MDCCSKTKPEIVGGVIPVAWQSALWEKEEKEGADVACWSVPSSDDTDIEVVPTTALPNPTPGVATAGPFGLDSRSPDHAESKQGANALSPADTEQVIKECSEKPRQLSPSKSTASLPGPVPGRGTAKAHGLSRKSSTISNLIMPDRRGPEEDEQEKDPGSPALIQTISRQVLSRVHEDENESGADQLQQHSSGMTLMSGTSKGRRRLSISNPLKWLVGMGGKQMDTLHLPHDKAEGPLASRSTNSSTETVEMLGLELFEFCLAICSLTSQELSGFLGGLLSEDRDTLAKAAKMLPSKEGFLKIPAKGMGGVAIQTSVVWGEVVHNYITNSRMTRTKGSASRLGGFASSRAPGHEGGNDGTGASKAVASLHRSETGLSNFSYTSCTDFNWRQQATSNQPTFLEYVLKQALTQNTLSSSNVKQHVLRINGTVEEAVGTAALDEGAWEAMTYCSAMDQNLWSSEAADRQMVSLDGFGGGGGQIVFNSPCLRTQNEWQREQLATQKLKLEALKSKLFAVENDHAVEHEVQEEQKELLRGFRKVVTREANVDAERPKVHIYIVEEDPQLQKDLVQLCRLVDFPCQAFSSLGEARKEIMAPSQDVTPSSSSEGGSSDWRYSPSVKKSGSMTAKKDVAKVVLLKHTALKQSVPPEWRTEGCFVVLTSHSEELEEVERMLWAAGEAEIRDQLRTKGVHEYLLHPLSQEGVQGVVGEAMRRRYDEYLLSKALGRGGSGIVYKAMRLKDGEVFALKEINTRRLSKKAQQEVESELKILRELSWPTLVFLVDAWVNSKDRLQYLLMPLLEGGSLMQQTEAQIADNSTNHTSRVLDWYAQTFHGVSYLHWRGVVHRDIKPGNLLLAGDQLSLQIGDLGSAASLPGSGPHPSRAGYVIGGVCTPLYSSPEAMQDDKHYAASDIWSIGVTFYEVFTLQSLFPVGAAMDQIKELAVNFNAAYPSYGGERNMAKTLLATLREKCLQTGQQERVGAQDFSKEIVELLTVDHLKRPAAAEIATRDINMRRLEHVLAQGALPDQYARDQHLRVYRSLLQDSKRALGWNTQGR